MLLAFGSFSDASAQFYNGTKVAFGKNRVQYDDFEWQFYRFESFETYFYTGGKDFAVHAAKYVNKRLPELQKFLDFYHDEPIQFVIYNKQSHFRQSNIGLSTDENYNIGGVTQIVGSKVFVYFDGSYRDFEKQIDAGLLEVLIYQMMYGGNWREVLRNSTLLTLPDWYVKGLVSYFSKPNDAYINARIQDGILNNDFEKFNSLNKSEGRIVGHAIWQYIADTYGENVISNVLYMTRVSREIEDGFLYVLGVTFKDLYRETLSYYENKIEPENYSFGEELPLKNRKDRIFQNFTSSPDGNYFAYSTNKMGQYKIYIVDKLTGKSTKIFKDEHKLERIQDLSYPQLQWHPSSKLLTFITEDKGEVLLFTYNVEDKDLASKPIFKIEKVLSYHYMASGKKFVFSGLFEGQTDLYLYSILGNTQTKLTDDIYDDLDPVVGDNDSKIYFISNRNNDSLNRDHIVDEFYHERDVFVYDLNNKEEPIQSVTDTDEIDESNVLLAGGKLYYSRADKFKLDRFSAKPDSAISKIDTVVHYNYFYDSKEEASFNTRLITQSSTSGNSIVQSVYSGGRYQLFTDYLNTGVSKPDSTVNTNSSDNGFWKNIEESFVVVEEESYVEEVDVDNYTFENQSINTSSEEAEVEEVEDAVKELVFPTQRIYRLNFRPDNSVLQLNNSFINGQYQLFNGGPYINSGLGVNTKIGIVDLMEDHRIYGGFRYAGELIEYSLTYQNLKKQLDKEYTVMRTRERVVGSQRGFRRGDLVIGPDYDVKTIRGVVSLSYPFSEITSIRGVASARNDKVIPLSSSQASLETDIFNEYWASAKAAYIYDNTREVATNILHGTRMNFFAEHYRLVASDNRVSESSNLSVVGFDARHYQKIHRELTFVARVAGSRSFGSTPLVYYLGGVDSWWSADIFNQDTEIDQTQNYNYQALAANLRGFRQNIKNGNSFAVINTELRWPIISYFVNRPIQSVFLRNFQIIGFGDLGTAWVGNSPFSSDNPLNNVTREVTPIRVTYENFNDPIVGGAGFGLRSTLFGYFVRVDWAWGYENGEFNKESQFILSLSLDI